jgi:hypothetical protein
MKRSLSMTAVACLLGSAAIASVDAVIFGAVDAQVITRERPSAGPPRSSVVVADSRFGHGSVSGPVRRGQSGWEVRLPRGTWVPCKRSCSEELRLATVDFWETQGRSAPDGGPGYFRFDFWF